MIPVHVMWIVRSTLLAVCVGGVAPSVARAESCRLAPQHAGVAFPVERVAPDWACRLQPIIEDFTTANKVGPTKVSLPEPLYEYLLDRPPTAAALLNRLELGLYKAEIRGTGRYWGDDGEGTSGLVELVYQDRTHRMYYLEGTHDSRLLRQIAGKAVVLLQMIPGKDAAGHEVVETTMVAYSRLDNRLLAGLVSLVRPLVSSTITRKLTKGVDAVNRLGLEMRHNPRRVLFEAADPPPLPQDDILYLQQALAGKQASINAPQKDRPVK